MAIQKLTPEGRKLRRRIINAINYSRGKVPYKLLAVIVGTEEVYLGRLVKDVIKRGWGEHCQRFELTYDVVGLDKFGHLSLRCARDHVQTLAEEILSWPGITQVTIDPNAMVVRAEYIASSQQLHAILERVKQQRESIVTDYHHTEVIWVGRKEPVLDELT